MNYVRCGKKLVFGTIILFIMASCMPKIMSINLRTPPMVISKELRILIVDDDDDTVYNSIQDAIDYAQPGDTIRVYNGTYREGKTINIKTNNLKLIGFNLEYPEMTPADWPKVEGDHIMNNIISISDVEKVRIEGFMVNGSKYDYNCGGIFLTHSDYCIITNNKCWDNWHGIHLDYSHNNDITFNTLVYNKGGIKIKNSDLNYVSQNQVKNNEWPGIITENAVRSIIIRNNCTDNGHNGIKIWQMTFTIALNLVLQNNIIDNGEHASNVGSINIWVNNWLEGEAEYPNRSKIYPDDQGLPIRHWSPARRPFIIPYGKIP